MAATARSMPVTGVEAVTVMAAEGVTVGAVTVMEVEGVTVGAGSVMAAEAGAHHTGRRSPSGGVAVAATSLQPRASGIAHARMRRLKSA